MGIISTVTRPWALYGSLALSAALGAGLVWQTLQRAAAEVRASHAERSNAQERETNERVARETTQAYRQLEAAFTTAIREAERAQAFDKARSERLAAGLRTERDQLRDEIAAFAAGGGSAADDSTAAARDRAAALGALLERALRVGAGHTAAAEEHAADVRGLLTAWPVNAP